MKFADHQRIPPTISKWGWSSKNHPPIVNEVGDDPQWGDLWKSTYSLRGEKRHPPKKVLVNKSISVFKFVCFRQVFVFDLSAAIWSWLVTAVYIHFDLISLIVFVALLRLSVWWWFCSWKWLWLQTYGTSGFVQTLHISMHHVKSMEVTHPMCEMLLVFFHRWWI